MIKKAPHILLRWSFFGGAIYFALICIVHIFGIKIPPFFIYYNLPSLAYQDKIIALLAFGWTMFLYSGYASTKSDELVAAKYIIISLFGAIVGLIIINTSTDFNALIRYAENLPEMLRVSHFWIEVIILLLYPIWLLVLYLLAKRKRLTVETATQVVTKQNPNQPDYVSEQENYARKWR